MNARHTWIRAMVLTVLAAAFACGSAWAGWLWDTNGDRIDDRMLSVENGGLTAAHVGGALTGKLRFAVLTAGAPFLYGVYIGYDHLPTEDDAAVLTAIGVPVQVRYRAIPYIRSAITYAQAQQIAGLAGVTRIETIPMMYAVNDIATQSLRARASGPLFPSVWADLGMTGKGVSVAILDSGVNDAANGLGYPGHESLRDKFLGGGSFFAGQPALNTPLESSENPVHTADPEATYHGTHVAGTAIGSGGPEGLLNDGAPGFYAGVAPGARLIDCKVLSDAGLGFGAADALEWLIYHRNDHWGLTGADSIYWGVNIASMSIGGTDNSDGSDASCAAVNAAVRAGIVCVIATGNDGNTNWMASPCAADLAISVGAFTDNNTVARGDDFVSDYSNEGPRLSDGDSDPLDEMKPSVLGDGTGVMSALGDPTSDGTLYHHINGTSMACPSISGVIALMLDANPTLTTEQVRQILQDTAEHRTDGGKQPPSAVDPFDVDPNYHPSWGWGQADAYAAVKEAQNVYQTQVVRMALTGQASPAGVKVEWWSQREFSLSSYAIDRAPDVLGGPGDWSQVHSQGVASPSLAIHAAPNRHHYEWIDTDPSLDPNAKYWYRVRWIDDQLLEHAEPALAVRIQPLPVVARVSFSWTHDYSDGDLDVRFGTGTDPEHPIWFRQGEGSPAADSIVNVGGVAFTGTLQHYFHVDLTADDMVGGFLPPSAANPWFLRVKEGGYINTVGRVNAFSVQTFGPGGQTYVCPQPVTPNVEKQSTIFWIPLNPALSLNHSPVIAPVGDRTVGEGLALNFTVNATDADNDPLTYSASSLPPGAMFNAGTREFSWTPGYAAAGSYSVRFVVSDGAFPIAAADTETVAITVTERNPGDNSAPYLDPLADRSGVWGETFTIRASGRDFEGGPLAFSMPQTPGGNAALHSSTGVFTWTPGESELGLHSLTIRVSDPGGLSRQQTIHLTVTPRQAAPPPATGCTPQHAQIAGVVGMGTDPGEKSVSYHSFGVPSGTQSITGSLLWFGGPVVDLDFYLLDADSNAVQSAASVDDPEVLTYNLPAPGTYIWKVLAFTNPDTAQYTIDYDLCLGQTTAVGDPYEVGGVSLANPWPNPFRVSCAIRFDLPRDTEASLKVYDIAGRAVRTLADGRMSAGRHLRLWDGTTTAGSRARAGVYFYRLETRGEQGGQILRRKAVLVE